MFAVNFINHLCLFPFDHVIGVERCAAIPIRNVVFSVMRARHLTRIDTTISFTLFVNIPRHTDRSCGKRERERENKTTRDTRKKRWGLIAYRERVKSPRALTSLFASIWNFNFTFAWITAPHSCVCPAKERRQRKILKKKMASTVRVSAFDQINGWLIVFFAFAVFFFCCRHFIVEHRRAVCDRLFGYFSTINIVFLFALFVAHTMQ